MLKAIATADRYRAVEIEVGNDESSYRTLSSVLTWARLSEESTEKIVDEWRKFVQDDDLLRHARDMAVEKLMLLVQTTFENSAPMLTWKLDFPYAWRLAQCSSPLCCARTNQTR